MHVRVSTKIEDRCRPLQTKDLALRNVTVFTVLVVTQEKGVDSAVGFQAFARVGHVRRWVSRKDTLDEFARQSLALRGKFGHGNSWERAVSPLKFNLCLDRSRFQKRVLLSCSIEGAEETLS